MDEEVAMASSECSSGCQSGWTTYLDDHSSASYSAGRFHSKARQPPYYYCDDHSAEEDDLSMISDASSGPRHQSSAGNDVEGAAAAHANAERRGRREAAAAARRQTKRAAAASQLEDTASSPAFYAYTTRAMGSGVGNGYGGAAAQMMEIGNAADFSYAFSTTTAFKSPLNGTAFGGGYMQMQYSPAPVNPMPARQEYRDAPEQKRW